MWDLPGPGIEPVSSASAGEFSATGPPGTSQLVFSCAFPLLFSYNRKSNYLGIKEPWVPMCETAKETQMYSLLDSVGEGEGGMTSENSIETCILSRVKQITLWVFPVHQP